MLAPWFSITITTTCWIGPGGGPVLVVDVVVVLEVEVVGVVVVEVLEEVEEVDAGAPIHAQLT
jgi:hypothetical protein